MIVPMFYGLAPVILSQPLPTGAFFTRVFDASFEALLPVFLGLSAIGLAAAPGRVGSTSAAAKSTTLCRNTQLCQWQRSWACRISNWGEAIQGS
jgi:hypothetical protein